jgi:hypothetical protein
MRSKHYTYQLGPTELATNLAGIARGFAQKGPACIRTGSGSDRPQRQLLKGRIKHRPNLGKNILAFAAESAILRHEENQQ